MIVPLVLALVTLAVAHPGYRDLMPNGYSVPNPCGADTWQAVGHYDPYHHTIAKNQFGKDFAAAAHIWTETLCKTDSDGDGKTNGEELGDPACIWNVGDRPAGSASGHPGICEPVGSAACSNQAFRCGCHGNQCVGR
ncbi:temptin-like [Crassostrea angulata]|uniref:Temptin Cys/Cys disulfide domain-containing protein n=1 Tax=Magallana gigas TaxID=29159 RepID=A0A8W8LCA4_MAGGI|nr:temptin [Crassostrea gigas]XP_052721511.1 temptin-like [Crassostrea angulata]